jgi:hypothetical protein
VSNGVCGIRGSADSLARRRHSFNKTLAITGEQLMLEDFHWADARQLA